MTYLAHLVIFVEESGGKQHRAAIIYSRIGSLLDAHSSMLVAPCSMLAPGSLARREADQGRRGCSLLVSRCSVPDACCSVLDARFSLLPPI